MQSVRDPVCGMSIDPQTAAGKSTYEGREYFFCSTECKRQFDETPGRYRIDDPPFTKKGDFVAPKFGSATSGGGEYEPLPDGRPDIR